MNKKKAPSVKKRKSVELGMLTGLLGYHLRRAQINNYRLFSETFSHTRITPTQLTIMILVELNPGISQVELGNILDMDRATTMTIIDKLESRNWLERRKSVEDRRKHALHLSSAGNQTLAKMKEEIVDVDRKSASALTTAERDKLLGLLKKLF